MSPADFLRAFAQVTHEIAAERDAERADHAETKKLVKGLEDDLRRKHALLVESETVRRAAVEESRQLRREAERLGTLLREARRDDTADLTAVVDAVADDLVRDAKAALGEVQDGGYVTVTADWLFGLAGRLRAAAGRDRIEVAR